VETKSIVGSSHVKLFGFEKLHAAHVSQMVMKLGLGLFVDGWNFT